MKFSNTHPSIVHANTMSLKEIPQKMPKMEAFNLVVAKQCGDYILKHLLFHINGVITFEKTDGSQIT